jgi:predicted NACHT family NTPase
MNRVLTWGVNSAFGFVFKTLLEELAREELEVYTKTFFQNTIPEWQGLEVQEKLELAFGQALREFLLVLQEELEDADCSDADLEQYINPLKKFIRDETVLTELGNPFADDGVCDASLLAKTWCNLYLQALPNGFNWEKISRKYTRKVKAIRQESDSLGNIFSVQNLASIRQNLKEVASIVPDLNLLRYREAIEKTYGYLRLDRFDTSGYSYNLKLWNMFVPQNVREVHEILPQLHELPKEHLERLKKTNQLEEDVDIPPEVLERYKQAYNQQRIRSVLEIIADDSTYQYTVILGDPGSGKSSLLQYLALQWAEKPITDLPSLPIPLLIELRSYIRNREHQECQNFLEFFQQGSGFICPLAQQQLHQLFLSGKAFVMFDGLDEVFEPSKREEAIADIINFIKTYAHVRVVITSRVIGYKPQRLQKAGFHHFILQDLEIEQINHFIDKWHDLAFGNTPEKERKRERLVRAIYSFSPIKQLASNPLLLTMMAILNRYQELPRDRTELYNQASRVLLQQWDVEKALENETTTIDYKDKQAMLRQVAYSMQVNKKGLAGNLITAVDLNKIITSYLKTIEVSKPSYIAELIINQLRERNFILCFMGADYYAFVHRAFLEYFCAWEFVWQYEKERHISLEYLKKQVFGKYWLDESWHEVLRLVAGMLDAKFTGEIIDYLITQNGEAQKFSNLFLAAKCLAEVRNRTVISRTAARLLKKIKGLTQYDLNYYYEPYEEEARLVEEIRTQAVETVAVTWNDDLDALTWLTSLASSDEDSFVRTAAKEQLAKEFKYVAEPRFKKRKSQEACKWALLVLNSNSNDGTEIEKLAKILENKYAFPQENIIILLGEEATPKEIKRALRELLECVTSKEDTVFIRFNDGNIIESDDEIYHLMSHIRDKTPKCYW